MSYRPGDTFYIGFTTQSISGLVTNADSLPTGSLRHSGATDAGVTISVTNLATGDYMASGTIPLTYVAGDDIELLIQATVGGVAGKAVIPMGKLDRGPQDVERALFSDSGTVWNVSTTGSDNSDGREWKTAFQTPAKAVSVASAGDVIVIGPGTFGLGNSRLTIPAGVMLAGAGMDRTILTSTATNTALVQVSSSCVVQDLTVQGVATPGANVYQYPIGDAFFTATNVVLRRVHTVGDTDGLYFSGTGSSAVGYGLRLTSNWDCVYCQSSTVELFDSELRTTGPNSAAPNTHGTAQSVSNGILRLTHCAIFSDASNSNPSRSTYGVRTDTGGTAELIGTHILLNVPDGVSTYDLKADNGTIIRVTQSNYRTDRVLGNVQVVTAGTLAPVQSFNNAGQTTPMPTRL